MSLLLLDTSVAIALRDADPATIARYSDLEAPPLLSVVSIVELEGGVASASVGREERRRALTNMLALMNVVDFGRREARLYGEIIEANGFARGRIIDRMIAASALAHGAVVATRNVQGFADVRDLKVEDWT